MRWCRASIVALVWVVLLCLTAHTRAQTANAKEKARKHYRQAEAYLKVEAYDEAIRHYEAAFKLVPKAGFLFNIGLAYEKKGDKKKALEYYQRYVRLEPDGTASEEAIARAHRLRRELEESPAKAASEQPSAGEPARPAGDGSRTPGPAAERPETGPTRTATAPPGKTREPTSRSTTPEPTGRAGALSPSSAIPVRSDQVDRPGRGWKVTGAVVAGAGVVLVAVGVYYGLQLSSTEDEIRAYLDRGNDWDQTTRDLEAEGERQASRANALYAVGSAALLGGAVLYYVGVRKGRRSFHEGVAVSPRGGGGAMVTWTCGF